MLKIGIQLKSVGDTLNIQLVDPTKKQIETATDYEKITAQLIKDLLNERLLDLLAEENKKFNEENKEK